MFTPCSRPSDRPVAASYGRLIGRVKGYFLLDFFFWFVYPEERGRRFLSMGDILIRGPRNPWPAPAQAGVRV